MRRDELFFLRNDLSNDRMNKSYGWRLTASSISIAALLFASAVAAQNVTPANLVGTWKSKNGEATYIFSKNHDFEYRRPLPVVQGKKNETSDSPRSHVIRGAWELGTPACTLGQTQGNLMLYFSQARCCFNVRFLGSNLILVHHSAMAISGSEACRDEVIAKDGQ